MWGGLTAGWLLFVGGIGLGCLSPLPPDGYHEYQSIEYDTGYIDAIYADHCGGTPATHA